MKLLVDMNLSPGWVDFLVTSGFEAVHWSAIGRGNESDAEVMRWAAEHAHIVLTADLDFGAILAATQRRQPSVIQIRADVPTPAAVGDAVLGPSGRPSANWKAARSFRSMPGGRECACCRSIAEERRQSVPSS
jgi:predicted nuclease of predicted toxin-antitoxin system